MSVEGRPIRVFLVDDVAELRELVRYTLEDDPDIEVVGEAATGRLGVEGVAETKPDVVLLDLSMPDMDGLEAIPLMRESAPDARLVVLSGHEAGRVSLEALDQGATRYVVKGSELELLCSTVHEVAAIGPPFADPRFSIVHRMWSGFLSGAIDQMLAEASPDLVWVPYTGGGRELGRDEAKAFCLELRSGGRVVDPRAYGQEPSGPGLIVQGTLQIWGPGGMSETPVYWAFCFTGSKVALAATYDQHEEAIRILRERCATT